MSIRRFRARCHDALWLACAVAAVSGVAPSAQAAESLYARAASVVGADWTVTDLEVLIDLRSDPLAGDLRIGRIDLPDMALSLTESRVRCGRIELTAAAFSCRDAQFTIDLPEAGRREFPGEVHYDRRSGAVRFDLRQVPLAGGDVEARGLVTEDATDLDFAGNALAIDALASLLGDFGVAPAGVSAAGTVDLSGKLRSTAGELSSVSVKAALRDASVSNEAGTIVSASAGGRIDFSAARQSDAWTFALEVAADSGEAYVEPVYADLARNAVTFTAAGSLNAAFDHVRLDRYGLTLGNQVEASGGLQVALPATDDESIAFSGSVSFVDASFPTLYANLLQVFAAGTLFGDLETAGTISGRVTFADNAPASADLELHDLIADDRQARFAVYGLNGVFHWPGPGGNAGDTAPSHVEWQGASAYDIALGPARIDALLGGDDIELTKPLRLPTMGGALMINRLAMKNYGEEDASGLLDAELEPIQLGLLTGAFGWPAFSGTLSGKLPLLQYDGQVMTVGGSLTARAFDGDIEFANLRLEQPFGRVPRLSGDLRLRQLDLEQVTNTFSFGLIQGRLSGDVTGLQMISWRPAAMDLHLYTPPGDRSRRRISQRAVEDLASVGGGGAAAALSTGFMSFFDEFSYRKIGLRCILANGVCKMSGAGPARKGEPGQGYYIVEGSGLPRIDVVGYRHEVSWPRLVRQLAQITESSGPTVR